MKKPKLVEQKISWLAQVDWGSVLSKLMLALIPLIGVGVVKNQSDINNNKADTQVLVENLSERHDSLLVGIKGQERKQDRQLKQLLGPTRKTAYKVVGTGGVEVSARKPNVFQRGWYRVQGWFGVKRKEAQDEQADEGSR